MVLLAMWNFVCSRDRGSDRTENLEADDKMFTSCDCTHTLALSRRLLHRQVCRSVFYTTIAMLFYAAQCIGSEREFPVNYKQTLVAPAPGCSGCSLRNQHTKKIVLDDL